MNNDFRKLKRFKEIIADAYQDPGCGGRPTHNMFDRIARENPHLIGQDIVAFYFEIIKYLSDQKMIEFY